MKTVQRMVLAVGFLCPLGLYSLAAAEEHDPGLGNKNAKVGGFLRVAEAYAADRDWPKAEEYLDKVLALDRRNVQAMSDLAWVNNEKRDYDRAGIFALAALLLDDQCAPAWRELGYARLQKKDYENATKAFKKAIEIDPADNGARKYLDKAQEGLVSASRETP